jgi:uncharacterized Zn-binding protein involved in type VI secretion
LPAINTGMPAISRHRDKCRTGHGCTRTAPVLCSQFTVFAEGKPILKRGDRVAPHVLPNPAYPPTPPKCIPHKAKLTGSSRTVFVGGIGVGRRGDKADFGAMIRGADTVFAG